MTAAASHWTLPVCEYRTGQPTPRLELGDRVHLCTAQYAWTVADVAQDGLVVLTPGPRDTWRQTHVAHVQHLDLAERADPTPMPPTGSLMDLLEET